MKITIKFSHNDSAQWPCCAGADLPDGEYVCKLGETWAAAEQALSDFIKARIAAGKAPEPKEVEIQ